jgi:acetyl-CoA carboxylase biotin carboxyl carrier protein
MSNPVDEKFHELLELAKKHNVTEVVWKEDDVKIAFRRSATPAAPTPAASADGGAESNGSPIDNSHILVKSPMVGTFRRSVSKGRPPLIMIGNHINPGDPLAVVECMKIPTDVVSYCAGEIREILVEDGHPVEYGQPLFSILPADAEVQG